MRARRIFLFLLILISFAACDKGNKNEVPLDQFKPDSTNDYKYIFKDTIKKEREKEQRHGRDDFRS